MKKKLYLCSRKRENNHFKALKIHKCIFTLIVIIKLFTTEKRCKITKKKPYKQIKF